MGQMVKPSTDITVGKVAFVSVDEKKADLTGTEIVMVGRIYGWE